MSSPEMEVVSSKHHNETFEPSFQPDSLPRISVPNLSEDVHGISAKDLAQIPTLNDTAHQETDIPAEPTARESHAEGLAQDVTDVAVASARQPISDAAPVLKELTTQAAPFHTDIWMETIQVRTEKLSQEIKVLHERLDGLQKQPKGY